MEGSSLESHIRVNTVHYEFSSSDSGLVSMEPNTILRVGDLAVFVAATAAYFSMGAPLWLFFVLALAPDISMLGYITGPQTGSRIYNMFPTCFSPHLLSAIGLLLGFIRLIPIGLVWAAHIGTDRTVGYGLRYRSGLNKPT
jgi:hypothetical protein